MRGQGALVGASRMAAGRLGKSVKAHGSTQGVRSAVKRAIGSCRGSTAVGASVSEACSDSLSHSLRMLERHDSWGPPDAAGIVHG